MILVLNLPAGIVFGSFIATAYFGKPAINALGRAITNGIANKGKAIVNKIFHKQNK